MRTIVAFTLSMLFLSEGITGEDKSEPLLLDVISYEDFVREDATALGVLERALYEKGIVGVKGIPGYRELVLNFINSARQFSALPEDVKESYGRGEGEMFLGYEKGKERFKNAAGKWVVDDLKISYYGLVPDTSHNKWPHEVDLRKSFLALGALMKQMGESVMTKIGLLGPKTGIFLDETTHASGRMLYYRKSIDGGSENPFWFSSLA